MKILQIIFLLFFIDELNSQINIGGVPFSFENPSYQLNIPEYITPLLNMNLINSEDLIDEQSNTPPRFGFSFQVSLNLANSGIWKTINSQEKIWQLKIKCQNSKSINLVFNKFHLSENSVLHIYNKNNGKIIGGFTHKNNKGSLINPKKFSTGLLYGNELILELRTPINQQNNSILEIGQIVHGYRFINYNQYYQKSFNSSSVCHVNINCPEGNSKQLTKKGISLVLIDGNRICTGSLINNVLNNRKLYFLTADHCLNGKDAISNPEAYEWSFLWDYEAPSCIDPIDEPQLKLTSGAFVIANNSTSDFALLELIESPSSYMPPIDVFFNGWDRNQPLGGGYGIHHPKGDIKKISHFTNSPQNGKVHASSSHWNVTWTQTQTRWGVMEKGSSGSPLFLNNNRIIGQLHGGPSSCFESDFDKNDDYGRFSVSWNSSSNSKRRLSNWLDPLNLNPMYLDGISGVNCATTLVNNLQIATSNIYQDCIISSANTSINNAKTIFQISNFSVINENFNVNNIAEFEIRTW
jgi:lysyl endopeptidase